MSRVFQRFMYVSLEYIAIPDVSVCSESPLPRANRLMENPLIFCRMRVNLFLVSWRISRVRAGLLSIWRLHVIRAINDLQSNAWTTRDGRVG